MALNPAKCWLGSAVVFTEQYAAATLLPHPQVGQGTEMFGLAHRCTSQQGPRSDQVT